MNLFSINPYLAADLNMSVKESLNSISYFISKSSLDFELSTVKLISQKNLINPGNFSLSSETSVGIL
jgi:hypothetical protein